jgi:hypothetical protein
LSGGKENIMAKGASKPKKQLKKPKKIKLAT